MSTRHVPALNRDDKALVIDVAPENENDGGYTYAVRFVAFQPTQSVCL